MIRRPIVAVLVSFALAAVAACGGDDDGTTATTAPPPTSAPPASTQPPTTTTGPTTPPDSTPDTTGAPATSSPDDPVDLDAAVRDLLGDAIAWLNGEPLDEDEYADRFAPAFIEVVPYGEFQEQLDLLIEQSPWEQVDEPEVDAGALVVELNDTVGDRFRLGIALGAGGAIELLYVEPIFDDPETPGAAMRRLNELGTLRFVEAQIEEGECRAVIDVEVDEPMPLGSTFKLYVLGAVVDAVEAGTIGWDTLVEVRDELRSIPAGITQDEPAGTEHTVEELATRMISISDNTATDLLIDLVGRDAVERALTDYGHADPSVTLPLLTTRELTILKFGDDELAERYVAASVSQRRAILDGEVADAELPALEDITLEGAATAETIEWFASPLDLCRALSTLAESPEALEILAINPGVPPTIDRWTYIGFKGGSSPGVLAVAWLVENEEGERTVVAGGVSNTSAPIPDAAAIEAFALLRDTAAP